MALAVALPTDWSMIRIYFGITIVLSIVGWTGIARVVRGQLLELREEDFVLAARLSGASNMRVIFLASSSFSDDLPFSTPNHSYTRNDHS